MLKKMVKITAVLLVLCLVVAAIAVFADSASCTLTRYLYYVKSGYAYGNYATGYLETKPDSDHTVQAKIYGDGAGYVSRSLVAAPGKTANSEGNAVSGFSAWYIYLQPVTNGGSGLGGHAWGEVRTTLTAR